MSKSIQVNISEVEDMPENDPFDFAEEADE
jgi:hypothetical protein